MTQLRSVVCATVANCPASVCRTRCNIFELKLEIYVWEGVSVDYFGFGFTQRRAYPDLSISIRKRTLNIQSIPSSMHPSYKRLIL